MQYSVKVYSLFFDNNMHDPHQSALYQNPFLWITCIGNKSIWHTHPPSAESHTGTRCQFIAQNDMLGLGFIMRARILYCENIRGIKGGSTKNNNSDVASLHHHYFHWSVMSSQTEIT